MKVLDFGIAKFIGDTLGANELTKTGAWIGTPPYMSPEQARGDKTIDHRTDLYSLGCLLYRAVTGRLPFDAPSDLAVLRKHVDDDPVPPSKLAPDLPEGLNDLILHLLRKSPDDRPDSAGEVHGRLRELLPYNTRDHANAQATRIVARAKAEADALLTEARAAAKRLLAGAKAEAERLQADAERQAHQIVEAAQAEAEYIVAVANVEADRARGESLVRLTDVVAATPDADFEMFWFAVPSVRSLYGEDGSETPIAELSAGVWYLAVEQRSTARGSALVAQTQDGRRGILMDTSGIQRG